MADPSHKLSRIGPPQGDAFNEIGNSQKSSKHFFRQIQAWICRVAVNTSCAGRAVNRDRCRRIFRWFVTRQGLGGLAASASSKSSGGRHRICSSLVLTCRIALTLSSRVGEPPARATREHPPARVDRQWNGQRRRGTTPLTG